MALEITPTWASDDHPVTLVLCQRRRELTITTPGETSQYVLCDTHPERLGWVARTLAGERPGPRRVTVGEVILACLREWEAEHAVLALTTHAARRASQRGADWTAAARRLDTETAHAEQRKRVSTLPFQVLFHQRSDPRRSEQPLTASLAAERIGYRWPNAKADKTRLRRRLGLADQHDKATGGHTRQRAVSYQTALALCTALDVDPVEVGL